MMEHVNKRGILLVAIGHPIYGRYAYNLALTIKAVEPDMQICVVHNNKSMTHLSEQQRSIFDFERVDFTGGGFACKTDLAFLSPFEETLFFDADMAWLPRKKPSDLFEELKDIEYTSITEGSTDDPNGRYYFWADIQEIRDKYKIEGIIYQWRSEVIYFKKTDKVIRLFDKAKEIYHNHGLSTAKKFGETVPDELAFNIACALQGVEPHVYKWCPSYWPRYHGNNLSLESIYSKHYLLSCGSNYSTNDIKRVYDRVMRYAAQTMKTQYVFQLLNKKDLIPERAKI